MLGTQLDHMAAGKPVELESLHIPEISSDLISHRLPDRLLASLEDARVDVPNPSKFCASTGAAGAGTGQAQRSSADPIFKTHTSEMDQTKSAIHGKIDKNLSNLAPGRRPLLLLCNGAYNPIHRQHTRIFYLARKVSFTHTVQSTRGILRHSHQLMQYLTATTTWQVVGGIISPWHQSTLKNALRRFRNHAIPAAHRVRMCEEAVESSSWLCVSDWEAKRKLPLDYPAVLRHMQQVRA